MIKNYELSIDGVIHQVNKEEFRYNLDYVKERYESYGELTHRMSHLRLGYVTGVLGRLPRSILDVGYGNGSFLHLCSKSGIKSSGYDISGWPVPEGCEVFSSIGQSQVEVATFFDSLEHFEDINDISKLRANYVIISVPWCHYYSDDWFEYWKHRRPNEHLWHFNQKSLTKFMARHGFSLISYSSLEDVIRKSEFPENILTAAFKRVFSATSTVSNL